MSGRDSLIVARAYAWWLSKRPNGWDERDHLHNPVVNCVGTYERQLAEAVADRVRANA